MKTKAKPKTKPKVLILTGYGINCDEETAFAFKKAGAKPELMHINDLINNKKKLNEFQILSFPGGFSYGDDTGAGNAFANRIRNHLWEELRNFVERDKLAIGICNGFQIMVNLGLLPALNGEYGSRQVALVHNTNARYLDRWVDLEFYKKGPWMLGLKRMSLPIAHGEGKFYTDAGTLAKLKSKGLVATRYIKGEICEYQSLIANPNGSLDDIAGITDESGRILGMMPHPERAISFTQLPHWTFLREKYSRYGQSIPKEADGLKIFRNGVQYFR